VLIDLSDLGIISEEAKAVRHRPFPRFAGDIRDSVLIGMQAVRQEAFTEEN
jgi:hypothetical protein